LIAIEALYAANFQPRFAFSGFQIHNDVSGAQEMRVKALKTAVVLIAAAAAIGVASARAADCGESADGFNEWLASFKQVAVRNGVSQQVVDSALNGVTFDPSVAAHDRGQNFGTNAAAFAARHISPPRVKRGKSMMLAYAEPLQRIEQRYGVPGPVLVAIWGLETDYGSGLGGYSTFSALATLAYDCRRAQVYRAELIDALMLVQRGLMRPSQRGAWAGEIGQTQFMPSAYLKYAVGAQGGGGDIISSPADALASTANFLRSKGWSPGAGWDEGQPNFNALLQWNSSPVYAKTVALFADQLAAK
jgi:membrane-bound lytic murein transglycosylase B